MSTPTHLTFQYDGSLSKLPTTVVEVKPATSLSEDDKTLFKNLNNTDSVVITKETIFHPQGGGQPFDVGSIKSTSTTSPITFTVTAVRTSVTNPGIVLHYGHFDSPASNQFEPSTPVLQEIDTQKRLLYSRYHTAGHVLGSAVRHLLEHTIPNFDELKASHVPDSASCEFAGLIPGTHKDAIQTKLDEYMARDMPVEIAWWDEQDFKDHGIERLTPDRSLLVAGETKFRVVKIVGAEVYPCGGTHVASTRECGKTTVKKISRQKGTSRVSYAC